MLYNKYIFIEFVIGDVANMATVDAICFEFSYNVLILQMLNPSVIFNCSENGVQKRD